MTHTKPGIRARVLARREALAQAERERLSDEITARILQMAAYRGSAVVLGYSSFGSEFATAAFIEAVLASGRTLVLPRVNRATRRLDLFRVADPARELVAGSWGIVEPHPERCAPVCQSTLDFVLVPGVAFDRRGARIGYGGGYYDKLFDVCFTHGRRPHMVAPVFACQMVDAVPAEAHDVLIDHIVTETDCFSLSGA